MELFQAFTDFVKGKSGSSDVHSAIISLGEDSDPQAFVPPKRSFSFKEFGAEYSLCAIGGT